MRREIFPIPMATIGPPNEPAHSDNKRQIELAADNILNAKRLKTGYDGSVQDSIEEHKAQRQMSPSECDSLLEHESSRRDKWRDW